MFARWRSIIGPLLVGGGLSLAALVFVTLAEGVSDGTTHAIDREVLRHAQALRADRDWLADIWRDLSGIGSAVSLTLVTLGSCGYLWLVKARATAMVVALSVISAITTVELLKATIGRLRPDSSFAQFAAHGLSFPSGHSSMAAVVFLTLGALVARTHARRAERVYIMAVAGLLTVGVGLSRAALGVHWATDVLGGWLFGSVWATLSLLVAWRLDRERWDSSR